MSNRNNNSEKISVKDELASLRAEITASQLARIQLLQYKLIAVASLAAVGLGFTEYSNPKPNMSPDLVLCIIPFVCAYVDLLCYHNDIRILVIACFLYRKNRSP